MDWKEGNRIGISLISFEILLEVGFIPNGGCIGWRVGILSVNFVCFGGFLFYSGREFFFQVVIPPFNLRLTSILAWLPFNFPVNGVG